MGNLEYLQENKTVTGRRQYSSDNDQKEKQTFLMVPLVSKIRGTKKVESVQDTCTDTAWNCPRTNLSKGSTAVKDERNENKKVESVQETCINTAWNYKNWAKHALFAEWTCIIQNIDNFIVYICEQRSCYMCKACKFWQFCPA